MDCGPADVGVSERISLLSKMQVRSMEAAGAIYAFAWLIGLSPRYCKSR